MVKADAILREAIDWAKVYGTEVEVEDRVWDGRGLSVDDVTGGDNASG